MAYGQRLGSSTPHYNTVRSNQLNKKQGSSNSPFYDFSSTRVSLRPNESDEAGNIRPAPKCVLGPPKSYFSPCAFSNGTNKMVGGRFTASCCMCRLSPRRVKWLSPSPTHTGECAHRYMKVYEGTRIYIYMYVYIYTYVHAHVRAYVHTRAHTHTPAHSRTATHACNNFTLYSFTYRSKILQTLQT